MEIFVSFHGNVNFKDINPMHVGESKCQPNHFWGPGYRDHWLIHYVVSGKGVFVHDDEIFHLSAGDCFIIKPGELNFYQADEKNPWHYIWFSFDANVQLPDIMYNNIIRSCGLGNIFVSTMRELKNINSKEPYFASRIWQLISAFHEMEGKISTPNYVEIAKAYIESEFSQNIKISDLASRLNLDRTYFSTLFKSKIGKSPQQYLAEVRLSKAKELMTKYNLAPSVVATSVGYADIFSFSRMFKRHFGISPTEYIENNKQQKASF